MSGLKLAILPVAESSINATTVILDCPGPVRIKGAELIVEGSKRSPDGTLNVTLRDVSVHAVVPPAAGLVESTEMFAAPIALTVVNVPM